MNDLKKKTLELDKYISNLRDILNEVSLDTEEEDARIIISRCLDELIVKYMNLKNYEDNI